MRQVFRFIAFVGLSVVVSLVQAQSGDAGIRVGSSMPLSGPMAESGKLLRSGASLYFDIVNRQGGVNGRKIEFEVLDDGYDPARAAENVRLLTKDRKVVALFGNVGTAQVIASLPVLKEAGVPLFGPVTGAPALQRQHLPQVFHSRPSYRDEIQRLVEHAKTIGVRKFAVFHTIDGAGKVVLEEAKDLLTSGDVQLVGVVAAETRNADFKKAAAELRASNCQAVIVGASGSNFTGIIGAYRALNDGMPQFYGLSTTDPGLVAAELGGAARGVVLTQIVPSVRNTVLPVVREYRDALTKARPGAQPTVLELDAFVGAKIFVEGLRRSGNRPSPEAVIAAFDSLSRYDAGGYVVSFSRENHRGAKNVDIAIVGADGRLLY